MEPRKPRTRDEVLELVRKFGSTKKEAPQVWDTSILKVGDTIDLVPFDNPNVKSFFILGIDSRPDDSGVTRTYLSGYETTMRDYSQHINNPTKLQEFAALTGEDVTTIADVARVAERMLTDAVTIEDSDMPVVEYDARAIGLAPLEDGDYTPYVSAFLVATTPAE